MVNVCVFFISAAALSFQVSLTRIFSISEWYHFAFMAISIALLGFGVSGALISSFPKLLKSGHRPLLSASASAFALTAPLSVVLYNIIPFDSYLIGIDRAQIFYLALIYLSFCVPFLAAGIAIGGALSLNPSKAHIVYFYNLAGSGLGCFSILLVPFLGGTDKMPLLSAGLGIFPVFLFSLRIPGLKEKAAPLILFPVIAYFLLAGHPMLEINPNPYKDLFRALDAKGSRILFSGENAISRIDLVESSIVKQAPGLSLRFKGKLPRQLGITVDGESLTGVSDPFAPESLNLAGYMPSSAAYLVGRPGRVLILEPMGGPDIACAASGGADSITVLESNPLIISTVRRAYLSLGSGRPGAGEPNIDFVPAQPRTYLAGRSGSFDVITIPLKGSFGAVLSGSFSLNEDFSLTVEALESYLEALSENGVIVITRWIQLPPSETLRAASTIIAALEKRGAENPGKHFIFFRSWMTGTFLVKKTPFTESETAAVRAFCSQKNFDPVWFSGITNDDINRFNVLPEPYYHNYIRKLLCPDERAEFVRKYTYNISKSTDAKPYFNHFFRMSQLPETLANLGKTWQPYGGGGYLMVFLILLVAIFLSMLLVLAPLCLKGGAALRGILPGIRNPALLYFTGLGFGFILVEITLVHYFILFIGQPTYAFAVVIASVLLFSSIGSRLSGRIKNIPAAILLIAALVGAVVLYSAMVERFFKLFIGYPSAARILLTLVFLAPLCILMGIPFPAGLRLIGRKHPPLVPWVWGVNGCASVIASILAMMAGLWAGFRPVLMLGAAFYLVSCLCLLSSGLARD